MPTDAPTLEEVTALASALQPRSAVVGSRIDSALCATPLIEKIVLDGEMRTLRLEDGAGGPRHGAGYVRVSTVTQQVLGFSIDDQIRNIALYFVGRKQAFRLYSDAGLSGSLPHNDPSLISRMVESKAALYEDVFTRVFLSPVRLERYTAAQEASVRRYLQEHLAEISRDNPLKSLREGKGHVRKADAFRPGLTLLMQDLPAVHTLAVNDLTRLSRNQHLFAHIAYALDTHKVRAEGTMERLDFLNREEGTGFSNFGNELQAFVLAKMAEMRLYETMLGDMRGLLTRLEQKRHLGRPPCWLVASEDEDGKNYQVRVKDGAEAVIQRLIALFVDEGITVQQIATRLKNDGTPCPSPHGVWSNDLVKSILHSRALLGYQCEFGLEFPIFPVLITEERWQQIRAAWNGRNTEAWAMFNHDWRNRKEGEWQTKYVATGLMRCVCAGSMTRGRGGTLSMQPSKVPESSAYICGSARRKPGQRHIRMQALNVHRFVDELMAFDPAVLLGEAGGEGDYQRLQDALRDARQRIVAAQAGIAQRRAEMRPEAEESLKAMGIRPSNAQWEVLVESMTRARLEEEEDSLRDMEREAQRLGHALSEYVPREIVATLRERQARWETLEPWQKNSLLLQVFERWSFRQIGDSDTDLEMVMVLRGGRELPPVRLTITDKKRSIWRRLPPVSEWMASVIAARRSKIGARS